MALTKAHSRMLANVNVTPEDFGAVGDGSADDTTALRAYLDHVFTYQPACRAAGVYKTTDTVSLLGFDVESLTTYPSGNPKVGQTIPERIDYGFTYSSLIKAAHSNTAVVIQGRGLSSEAIRVEYTTGQARDADTYGISLRNVTFCTFGMLYSLNACRNGVDELWAQSTGNKNQFWSNNIGIIWMSKASRFLFDINSAFNNGWNTPSTIAHMYLDGRHNGTGTSFDITQTGATVTCQGQLEFGLRIKRTEGIHIGTLNIERAVVDNTSATEARALLKLDDGSNIAIGHLHMEGVACVSDFSALIVSFNSTANIQGMTLTDSDNGGQFSRTGCRTFNIRHNTTSGSKPAAFIDVGSLTWTGRWFGGTSPQLCVSEYPSAISIQKVSDQNTGSPSDDPLGALTNSDGTPKATYSAYSGSPYNQTPVFTYFNGSPIMPAARIYGGGGTQTGTGLIDLSAESYDNCNMAANDEITIPVDGIYAIEAGGAAGFNGSAFDDTYWTVRIDSASGTIIQYLFHDRGSGTTAAQNSIGTASTTYKLSAGDQIGLYSQAGATEKTAKTFLAVRQVSI
jgi:hypothetical protein